MRRFFAEVKPDSLPALSPPQVHMIMTIRQHKQVTIKQLAGALHVKAPAVSTMVERLVEQGILTREENPADRREVLVRVSPRDESQLQAMERRHLQFAMDLFDKIGIKDARAWANVCTRIQEVLAEEQNS
jgi:DNA-binding MarR family transcriptional regulator